MVKSSISGFKITTSNQVISQRVRRTIATSMESNSFFARRSRQFSDVIAQFLYEKLITSSTYYSLTSGTLRAELGLDDENVSKIPDAIVDMIGVDTSYNISNGQIKIIIKFVDDNFDPNENGSYISINKKGESYFIPWLLWLLTAGDSDVVVDHFVALVPGEGRSEMAIMVKKEGETFSIEPYYAGTPNDNWLTRTVKENIQEIKNIIIGILKNDP